MTIFRYGIDSKVSLQPPDGASFLSPTVPQGEPLDSIAEAVQASLQKPIEFPSLDQMILPDDSVAIALQPSLPCAAELVAGAVAAAMSAGVPPELITIVRGADDVAISDKQLLGSMDSHLASRLVVVRHDPKDREQLCFLGASKHGEPIYINRHLADAAVVLPVGVLAVGGSIHDCWYPTFADSESITRSQQNDEPSQAEVEVDDVGEEEEVDDGVPEPEEVGWMLGVQFVIQVVPAGNDQALHVLAGLPQAVLKHGAELLKKAWDVEVPEEVGLVIAGIGGGPEQQTWDNITRTIAHLTSAVQTDGAIAICSELKAKPGAALRRLTDLEDYADADPAIQKKAAVESIAAKRLLRARQRVRVYLLSHLDEEDIEDVGVAYISDAREISKLASQFDSCMTLENAQHISIRRNQPVDHQ